MLALFLSLLLTSQGPLPGPQRSGTITGVVRDSAGNPIAGMRIGAMARPNSVEEAGRGTAMLSIAESDFEGRFTLEAVPPGLYYIAAGRLDRQTFYPGTLTIEDATVVTVPPGGTISGLEMTISNTSVGRAPEEMSSLMARTQIPLQVLVADGDKVPVFHAGRAVLISLESIGGAPMPFPMTAKSLTVPGPVTLDYRVTIENLPENYALKSLTYGSTDLLSGTFRLTPQNFPRRQGASEIPPIPPLPITVTLQRVTKAREPGARVTGKADLGAGRQVYLAGKTGTLYSDGTFEFTGVMPGLYSVFVAGVGFRGPFHAASITVGDRDSEVARFEQVPLLPSEMQIAPGPVGSRPEGSTVSLARLRGTLREETSREPISEGLILLKNDSQQAVFKVDATGKFELPPLLPGTYAIEAQVFGHVSPSRSVEVGATDMVVDLSAKRLY